MLEKERLLAAKTFQSYAPTNLHIRTESEGVKPFRLNSVQLYIHEKLEEQLERLGYVRALILKGRKQGCSTYVAGRFYYKTTHNKGIQTTIMAHEQKASETLFGIVDLFHAEDPHAIRTATANSKELNFADIYSGYSVLTAGSKATGRSSTPQLLHGSEFAFWPNAAGHMAGIIQAVPEAPGTEIILESTAFGMGNAFHTMWQTAESGNSDYIPIFIPWFWTSHYQRPVPNDFVLSEEEEQYKAMYSLTNAQMAWKRNKESIPDGKNIFRQEYPATAAEAFEQAETDSYIPGKLIAPARKNQRTGVGPLIIGADPARYGKDRFSIIRRQGRRAFKLESKLKVNVVVGANWIKGVIDREKPSRVFIDLGGVGAGTFDILQSWGEPYMSIVKGVNFGSPPMEEEEHLPNGDIRPGPLNRRSEMWKRSKEWLEQEGGVEVPDQDSLQSDGSGPNYKYDMKQRLQLEKKEDMMKRGIRSPDEWDALALTFAEPVHDIQTSKPLVKKRGRDETVGV